MSKIRLWSVIWKAKMSSKQDGTSFIQNPSAVLFLRITRNNNQYFQIKTSTSFNFKPSFFSSSPFPSSLPIYQQHPSRILPWNQMDEHSFLVPTFFFIILPFLHYLISPSFLLSFFLFFLFCKYACNFMVLNILQIKLFKDFFFISKLQNNSCKNHWKCDNS